MLHDTEISLLVSYSRRIVTHVYQEYFISFVVAKKKKNPGKKTKWTSIVKWRNCSELETKKMKINEAEHKYQRTLNKMLNGRSNSQRNT